jgi:hypothetical protein
MVSLITYHSFLAYALIAVIVLNYVAASGSDYNKVVKRTRIGFFSFWGVWSMVLFAGLVVFVFMKQPLTLSVIVMIAASIALPFIDGYRAINLGKIWRSGEIGSSFSKKMLLIELAVMVATVALALAL